MQEKDTKQSLDAKDDSLYREESIGIEEKAIEEQEVPSSNSRIAKNALMLYIRMFLTMIVGLYTSRVVLNTLGVEDYGIYGVVGGVVAMLGFLNASMSGATSRFLTFELGRGDKKRLAETFSSALIVHIIIALIVFVLAETVGLWFVTHKLVIPAGRMTAAHWVYQMSILSAMLGITQVPYNATIIAHEKMDIYAYVEILNVTLKLLIVYLLTIGNFDKLILYALLVFAVSVIIIMVYRIYCIRHFPESHFLWIWNPAILKPLISFSCWDLYGNGCVAVRQQGTNFLINVFFGVIYNAASGIASTVQGVVLGFTHQILTAFRPQIIKLYASGSPKESVEMIYKATRLSSLLIVVIAIPFCIQMSFILELWLKTVPPSASIFCQLLLVSACLNVLRAPLMIGIHATGKIKRMSLITGSCFLIGVVAVWIGYLCGLAVEFAYIVSVAINLVLIIVVANLLSRLIVLFSFWDYFMKSLIPVLVVACASLIIIELQRLMYSGINSTIGNQIGQLIFNIAICLLIAFLCGVNNTERRHLIQFLKKRMDYKH